MSRAFKGAKGGKGSLPPCIYCGKTNHRPENCWSRQSNQNHQHGGRIASILTGLTELYSELESTPEADLWTEPDQGWWYDEDQEWSNEAWYCSRTATWVTRVAFSTALAVSA